MKHFGGFKTDCREMMSASDRRVQKENSGFRVNLVQTLHCL